jgi:hypothetical protein
MAKPLIRGSLSDPPFQCDYAGHSFRIGAATIAAMAAVEDSALAECCLLAVHWATLDKLAAISCQLATAGSSPVPSVLNLSVFCPSLHLYSALPLHMRTPLIVVHKKGLGKAPLRSNEVMRLSRGIPIPTMAHVLRGSHSMLHRFYSNFKAPELGAGRALDPPGSI